MLITLDIKPENQRNNLNKLLNPCSRDKNHLPTDQLIQLNKMLLEIVKSQN